MIGAAQPPSPAPPRWQQALLALAALLSAGLLTAWQHDARSQQRTVVGAPLDRDVVRGFYEPERSAHYGGLPFRWSTPDRASLRFWPQSPVGAQILQLTASVPRGQQQLTLAAEGAAPATITITGAVRTYQLLLPARAAQDPVLSLRSPPFPSGDSRALGVVVWRAAAVQRAGGPLALAAELLLFPQLPLLMLVAALCYRRRPLATAALLLGLSAALALCDRLALCGRLTGAAIAWYLLALALAASAMVWLAQRRYLPAPRSDRGALLALTLCTLLLLAGTYLPRIIGDGIGYYAYARSLVVDRDLQFSNEFLALWGRNPFPDPTRAGLTNNPFALGSALVWMPPLAVTHALVSALGAPYPSDGYSEPYVVSTTLTSALSALAGLYLTYRACRRWGSPAVATAAALGSLVGSTYWYYALRAGSQPHALSAAAAALLLLAWLRLEERQTRGRWVAVGLAVGLTTVIYWLTVLLAAPVVLLLLRSALALARARRWAALARLGADAGLAGAAALLVFAPQMLAWQVIYGTPLIKPLTTPTLTSQVHLLDLLVQPYGVLFWTPAMALGLLGCALLLWHQRALGAGILIACGAYLLSNSALNDWHGSGAFGLRRLTTLAPYSAVGLTLIFVWLQRLRRHALAALLLLASAGWSLMLMIRFDLRYFPDGTPRDRHGQPIAEFLLTRSAFPTWAIGPYLEQSYIGQILAGGSATPLLIAAAAPLLALALLALYGSLRRARAS